MGIAIGASYRNVGCARVRELEMASIVEMQRSGTRISGLRDEIALDLKWSARQLVMRQRGL